MKPIFRHLAMPVLLLSLLLAGGCDMFRRMAGRPTSRDIERKREEIAHRQAETEARKAALRAEADSLALLDSIRGMSCKIKYLSEMGGVYTTDLTAGYYIIVGAFGRKSNADAMLARAAAAGYVPVLIPCRSGLQAVGLSPADRLEDAFLSLKSVRREEFCPEDVWILVNR